MDFMKVIDPSDEKSDGFWISVIWYDINELVPLFIFLNIWIPFYKWMKYFVHFEHHGIVWDMVSIS